MCIHDTSDELTTGDTCTPVSEKYALFLKSDYIALQLNTRIHTYAPIAAVEFVLCHFCPREHREKKHVSLGFLLLSSWCFIIPPCKGKRDVCRFNVRYYPRVLLFYSRKARFSYCNGNVFLNIGENERKRVDKTKTRPIGKMYVDEE